MILSIAILVFVTLQRVSELVLAARNTRRLLAQAGWRPAKSTTR